MGSVLIGLAALVGGWVVGATLMTITLRIATGRWIWDRR